jgi:hypothetical protein
VQQAGHRQSGRLGQVYLCIHKQELEKLSDALNLELVMRKERLQQLLQLFPVLFVLKVVSSLLLLLLLLLN